MDRAIYTISFSLSPSSETIPSVQVVEGNTCTLPQPSITYFEMDGYSYTFDGYWSPYPGNVGGKVQPGTVFTPTKSMTIGTSWLTETLTQEDNSVQELHTDP